MAWRIRNIVFECPDPEALAAFYGQLLGMYALRKPPDWTVIGREGELPRLAFDHVADYRPPRWPDPEYPQQLHLDIRVPDLAATEAWLAGTSATRLPDIGGDGHVWADPAGHPFCLTMETADPPRIENVVFDSEDHTGLAAFYGQLLGLPKVGAEWDDWVMLGGPSGPRLAFLQVAVHRRPRWPDPEHPQQLHLDIQFDDQAAAVAEAVRLGAGQLPPMGGDAPVLADPAGHPFCALPMYKPAIKQLVVESWVPCLEVLRSIGDAEPAVGEAAARAVAGERFRLAQLRGAFGGPAPDTAPAGDPLAEALGLQAESLQWLDDLDETLLDVEVGWTPDRHQVMRTRQLPAALDPLPVWRFVQPGDHLKRELDQLRGG